MESLGDFLEKVSKKERGITYCITKCKRTFLPDLVAGLFGEKIRGSYEFNPIKGIISQ
jgi:hypothetical protein